MVWQFHIAPSQKLVQDRHVMSKTLIIDNYDSFTYNLFHAAATVGADSVVYRNDNISLAEIVRLQPAHIIISPGPGTPVHTADIGISSEVIQAVVDRESPLYATPLLGVCLGHQAIAHHLGARIIHAPEPVHGKTSEISHEVASTLFHGIPKTFTAMRYHSLIIDESSLPPELLITARTSDPQHLIMAIQHVSLPLFGVQFHPESIGTPDGLTLLRNFLVELPRRRA